MPKVQEEVARNGEGVMKKLPKMARPAPWPDPPLTKKVDPEIRKLQREIEFLKARVTNLEEQCEESRRYIGA